MDHDFSITSTTDTGDGPCALAVTVRPALNVLERDGGTRRISHKAMQVLCCLSEQPGEVVHKAELFERVWDGAFTSDEALSTVIYELRRALGDRASCPAFLATIRKRGYRLTAEVDALVPPSRAAESESPTDRETAPPTLAEETAAPATPSPTDSGRRRRWIEVVAILVIVAGIAVFSHRSGTESVNDMAPVDDTRAEIDIRSLAVLPLASSETSTPDLFAQGLTTMLTADLAGSGSLDVLSGLTTVHEDAPWSVPKATELTADAYLEGLVQRSGNRLWLSVKLVDSLTGRVLWGGTYERAAGDELALQRELALKIGEQIRRRLERAPQSRIADVDEWLDPRASEAFHLGRYFLEQHTADGHAKALQHFQMAIELEPGFAPAHAGLANTYLATAEDLPAPSQAAALEKARTAAETALALDTDLPEAHLSMASIFFQQEWDWQSAEKHFRLGYEPNTCSVEDGYHYARYLSAMGRHDEALSTIERCLESDPASKLGRFTLAWVHYMARRYDDALDALSWVEELDPNFPAMCRLQEDVFLAKGDSISALAAQRRFLEVTGATDEDLKALESALAHGGIDGAYRWLLARTTEQAASEQPPTGPVRLAALQVRHGDHEQAMASLERAYEERHSDLVWIRVDPAFDALRDSPRFQALVDRLERGI